MTTSHSDEKSQGTSHGCTIFMVAGIFLLVVAGISGAGDGNKNDHNAATTNAVVEDADEPASIPNDEPVETSSNNGQSFPVWSDPNAEYRLLKSERLSNDNLEVLTRRDGPSGTSYSRREINCDAMTFRYLGTGDTRAEAEVDKPDPDLSELTEGSISTLTAEFVCSQAKR